MEKNLKIKKIISIILVALMIFSTKVCAANTDSYTTTISTANMQVKRGDTITVAIGLKDIAIESGDKGIGAYTATLNFDTSVLEYIKSDSTDAWEAPFYQGGNLTGNTKDGEVVKENGNIGTITFKVKDNAKLGDTTISLNNFSGSNAKTDVPTEDVSIKITVRDNKTNNENSNNHNGGNNQNGNGNHSSNQGDNSIKGGKLPQTGETNIGVYITIGACALIATISFIKIVKSRA